MTGCRRKLRQTAELSRSAMWELRHPIDGGQLFRGEDLGEVLETHANTFTVITSVPAEFVQPGREPPLSTIAKSLLFSIAHNALTNVLRHAQASRVLIELDCTGEQLRLSVSDDGHRATARLRGQRPRVQEYAGRRRANGRKPRGESGNGRQWNDRDLRRSLSSCHWSEVDELRHPNPGNAG